MTPETPVRIWAAGPNNNGKCMNNEIKNLIDLNKAKRQTYIKEKHSEAFQTALTKIQNYLKPGISPHAYIEMLDTDYPDKVVN